MEYAKNWNLYKQVRYLPTKKSAKQKDSNTPTEKQQHHKQPMVLVPPPKKMPQIPNNVNEMLSDKNVELGTQTQTQTQTNDLVDSPTSSQGNVEATVIGGPDTNNKSEGDSAVLADTVAKSVNETAESEVLLTDSQLEQSPDFRAIGMPPDDENGGDVLKEGVQQDETLYDDGHDDPEVVVIDQDCLDAFVKDQCNYATTMGGRKNDKTETQEKLAQFYGEDKNDRGAEAVLPSEEDTHLRHNSHFGDGELSTKTRLVRRPDGEFDLIESDVEEDDIH